MTDDHQSQTERRAEPDSLVGLLQLVSRAEDASSTVRLGAVLDMIGRRSFGPMLLLAGLIVMAPLIGDIPGVPTVIGVFVFLVALQLLLGREHFWLPEWLLARRIPRAKLHKAVVWMMPVARFIDRFLGPRLTVLVNGGARIGVALLAMLVSLLMPVMEFIPFSANAAGVTLTVFGLALIARDGLLALIAFALTGMTIGVIVWALL
ncbi:MULTISPECIES: exopolysaccharide biosynthesis protein [unclassified Guyparkeria]|uniref:exopolysaccharide biosynthesis protein n=1 Tax=unclassified Guyparkeria TaxID=2626246 RepID=UPI0007333D1A|nr:MULTISPECIES: exopolysaccharide biosynthesis protein [unclassified Guyparkeria]KTG15926.1 exopolysaccharide biosynthesis protein [Guyparkeria sp. XI15]OAE84676.1 exopolysaccharide biosynthesis protein [Guyparkeria sp. WRN-7]